jgi:hypothetical protein
MHHRNHVLYVVAIAAGLVSSLAIAGQTTRQREQAIERASPDLVPTALQRRLSHSNRTVTTRSGTAVTTADVGDADSFGRNVTWLGVTSAFIDLDPACPPPSSPDQLCQTLAPAPSATNFRFVDAARIVLPAKATHSLLCYWFSPVLSVTYDNPTAAPVIARFRYTPTLTVENPVLADPTLIDPTTGAPFAGSLLTSMTSSEFFEQPVPAGVQFTQHARDSAVCMAGLLSRRALIETYGLTGAQADEFFRQPTTVRMNIAGSAQYVGAANLVFGLRIVGD